MPISLDEFTAALAAGGEAPDVVALLRYLFSEVLVPENAGVADGVRQVTGREPRDFAAFARAAARERSWERSRAA